METTIMAIAKSMNDVEWCSRNITIVLTTSPIRTHPSTRLIEETFVSFTLCPELVACPKIIIADGVKIKDQPKYRSGIVSNEAHAAYRHYLYRLAHLTESPESPLFGARLINLQERHGFAHALRRGLVRVTTPYLLVAQHDRSFRRQAPVTEVLKSMEGDMTINYVGFPTSSTIDYVRYIRDKYAIRLTPVPSIAQSHLEFIPLVQWYDSMHVAKTDFYLSRVFGKDRFVNLPPGGFIEDTLGQAMLAAVRSEGVDALEQYGVFVCNDQGGVAVGHIDGHDSRTAFCDCRKFDYAHRHTSEEEWQAIEQGMAMQWWLDRDAAMRGGELPYEVLVGFNDDIDPATGRHVSLLGLDDAVTET